MASAGNSQATAAQIVADVVRVTSASGGVILDPHLNLGEERVICNGDSSNTLTVYPRSGGRINNAAINGSISITPNSTGVFRAINALDTVAVVSGGNASEPTFTSTAAANASSFVWGNGSQTVALSTRDAAVAGSIGVGYLRATTTNTPTVLDIMPNGNGGSDPTGVTWIDLCDRDLSAPGSTDFQSLLLACISTGECRVGTHFGGSGTAQILKLGGSQVQFLSQAFGTATQLGYVRDLGLYVGGSGTEKAHLGVFGCKLANSLAVTWQSSGTDINTGTTDTGLSRTAAGVVSAGNGTDADASGSFNAASYKVAGTQVVGSQITGYGTPTGGSHQSSFAAGSISLANLAAAVAQLIVDLKTHGLLGA